MRRAAPANWSRLPNRNRPRFYTAWVIRVAFVMSANVRFQDDFGHGDFG
jgi:hypothetical protein